jgi:hypothetical protein
MNTKRRRFRDAQARLYERNSAFFPRLARLRNGHDSGFVLPSLCGGSTSGIHLMGSDETSNASGSPVSARCLSD